MRSHEYNQAVKSLGLQKQILMQLKTNNPVFKNEFEKFMELLIAAKGHAWCMDVKSERRKMAKLLIGASRDILLR